MIKIIRGYLPQEEDLAVYAADNANGFAEVTEKQFDDYLAALKTVCAFELEVDMQYRNKG